MHRNQRLIDRLKHLSRTSGHTPAQLAIVWLLAKSPSIVPIPGMKRRRHLKENATAAAIRLSPESIEDLNGLGEQVAGERRNAHNLKFDEAEKVTNSVTPAEAGAYNYLKLMDPRLPGDDNKEGFSTFYETIKFVDNDDRY